MWLSSLRAANVNRVDTGWGLGFVLVAWTSWLLGGGGAASPTADSGNESATWLLLAMVSLWGLRLGAYLTWRNWGKPEDHRYAAMRNHWGEGFARRSLITIFGLQAVLLWFISLTLQLGMLGELRLSLRFFLGAAVWLVGWVFESVGDWQLARFKRDPANRGQVMARGLWSWTRHPNYFGDFLVWWGFYLMAAQPGSWWWTWTGPLLMSVLLMRVSGVTLLESSLSRRKEGYAEYVQRTSAFFPGLPSSIDISMSMPADTGGKLVQCPSQVKRFSR